MMRLTWQEGAHPLLKRAVGLLITLHDVTLRQAWVGGLFTGLRAAGRSVVQVETPCERRLFTIDTFPVESLRCRCGEHWLVAWEGSSVQAPAEPPSTPPA